LIRPGCNQHPLVIFYAYVTTAVRSTAGANKEKKKKKGGSITSKRAERRAPPAGPSGTGSCIFLHASVCSSSSTADRTTTTEGGEEARGHAMEGRRGRRWRFVPARRCAAGCRFTSHRDEVWVIFTPAGSPEDVPSKQKTKREKEKKKSQYLVRGGGGEVWWDSDAPLTFSSVSKRLDA